MRVKPLCMTLLLFLGASSAVQADAPVATGPAANSPAIEQRVDAMLDKLILAQKVDLIGGENNMYIRAVYVGDASNPTPLSASLTLGD